MYNENLFEINEVGYPIIIPSPPLEKFFVTHHWYNIYFRSSLSFANCCPFLLVRLIINEGLTESD